MKKNIFLVVLAMLGFVSMYAQKTVKWSAVVKDESGLPLPLVQVIDSTSGARVTTNGNGKFTLEIGDEDDIYFLFPEMVDYHIQVHTEDLPKTINLRERKVLTEAVVTGREVSSKFNQISATQLLDINKNEFKKAACCNLSESFDNTPAIDVSYTDGLTGMKQIKLLGLQMSDIFMTMEGIPYITGISTTRGLTEIPATWVESMQLSKGIASVVNGMEGSAGQINIELKKPLENSGVELNLFQNNMGRSEVNANGFWDVSPKISTSVLTHYSNSWRELDQNEDQILDRPLGQNFSIANKWQYFSPNNGFRSQLNLIYAQQGNDYGALESASDLVDWEGRLDYDRQAVTWKLGKVFEGQDWKSFGFQAMASQVAHDQSIYTNSYSAKQSDLYANFIYQTILVNEKNPIRLGTNVYSRQIEENLSQALDTNEFTLDEKNVGVFAEYTYVPNKDFTLVVGNRLDYNSVLDFVYTPRMHVRYKFKDIHTLKFQIGKATKINNIYQENIAFLNSTRKFRINTSPLYGEYYSLPPQVSWNTGLQYLVSVPVGEQLLNLSLDYQRTWFTSGYLRDFENSESLSVSALPGDYISQVFQAQVDVDFAKNWSTRLAYRYNDVRLEYNDGVERLKPLMPKYRAFLNVEFNNNKWVWSQTLALTGSQRLSASYYPDSQVSGEYSPAYVTYSTQLTRTIRKDLDVYLGVENLGGFTQDTPIYNDLGSSNPRFESALVWGPINRQVVYLGLNFKIMQK